MNRSLVLALLLCSFVLSAIGCAPPENTNSNKKPTKPSSTTKG